MGINSFSHTFLIDFFFFVKSIYFEKFKLKLIEFFSKTKFTKYGTNL